MERTIAYRGFDICVKLEPAAGDMFEAWFSVEGAIVPAGVIALGTPIKVRNGPFSR